MYHVRERKPEEDRKDCGRGGYDIAHDEDIAC